MSLRCFVSRVNKLNSLFLVGFQIAKCLFIYSSLPFINTMQRQMIYALDRIGQVVLEISFNFSRENHLALTLMVLFFLLFIRSQLRIWKFLRWSFVFDILLFSYWHNKWDYRLSLLVHWWLRGHCGVNFIIDWQKLFINLDKFRLSCFYRKLR